MSLEMADLPASSRPTIPQRDLKHVAMRAVCIVLICLILVPVVPISLLWLRIEDAKSGPPSNFLLMLLKIIPGLQEDFSKINALLMPIFALAAGIQARTWRGGRFFLVLILISLVGAIASLFAEWFIVSDVGEELLRKDTWIGQGEKEFPVWQPQARSFFRLSFQTFLTYTAILLGLRAADTR